MTSPLFDLPEAGEIFGAPFAPTGSGGHGAQERSRDGTACGARLGARPLTAPSTVAFVNRFSSARQRSGEFSTGTFGEISTGIDKRPWICVGRNVTSQHQTSPGRVVMCVVGGRDTRGGWARPLRFRARAARDGSWIR